MPHYRHEESGSRGEIEKLVWAAELLDVKVNDGNGKGGDA
jgi:hypothetical protein